MGRVVLLFSLLVALATAAVQMAHAQYVDDFQPHSGPQTGKTLVTVFGTKFVNNGQTFLRFINIGGSDRVDVPVIFVNENTLIATTTPFNATGDHDVEITFDNGQSFVSFESEFIVYPHYFPDSFAPLSGPITGGSEFHLYGHFTNTGEMSVMFDIFNSDYVYSDAFWVDEYTLRVVTKRFPHAGEYDVSLALNGQQYDAYFSNAYIVYDDDLIYNFSPSTGPLAGGTSVVINGAYFSNTGEHTVKLVGPTGEELIEYVNFVNSNTLEFKTPKFTSTGVYVLHLAQNGVDYEDIPGSFAVY